MGEWLEIPAHRVNEIDRSFIIHIKDLIKHNMGEPDEVLCENYKWTNDYKDYTDDYRDDYKDDKKDHLDIDDFDFDNFDLDDLDDYFNDDKTDDDKKDDDKTDDLDLDDLDDYFNDDKTDDDKLDDKQKYIARDGCVNGANMEKLSNISLKKCQEKCDKNTRCLGVEYFKRSGAHNASSTYEEGDCNLSSGKDIRGCDVDKW